MENEQKTENQMSMQDELLQLIKELREDNFDFDNDAAVYMWRYEAEPDIVFELSVYDVKNVGDEVELDEFSSPPVVH